MKVQIMIEPNYIGWIAYKEYACLCPECHAAEWGKTISDALENLIDKLMDENGELEYNWKGQHYQ